MSDEERRVCSAISAAEGNLGQFNPQTKEIRLNYLLRAVDSHEIVTKRLQRKVGYGYDIV
jgi:hypothetical protein